ncbi:hypothetical protein ACH0B6_18450 [Solibacillus silvestris]
MEKLWNEEVVELLTDLEALRIAENEGTAGLNNLLYSWLEEYFKNTNFNSPVLKYVKLNDRAIKMEILSKVILIQVDGASELIKISEQSPTREYNIKRFFSLVTFKDDNQKILCRKTLFEFLDHHTAEVIKNYSENLVYL